METQKWFDDQGEVIDLTVDIEEFALEGITRFEQLLRRHQEFAQYLAEHESDA